MRYAYGIILYAGISGAVGGIMYAIIID